MASSCYCHLPLILPFLLLKCRLKIFVPIAFLAFAIMVPVNWTNATLEHSHLTYSDIDKLSISNIPIGSHRYAELSFAICCILFVLYIIFLILSWSNVVYEFPHLLLTLESYTVSLLFQLKMFFYHITFLCKSM